VGASDGIEVVITTLVAVELGQLVVVGGEELAQQRVVGPPLGGQPAQSLHCSEMLPHAVDTRSSF
jgi:hypothetical protein